MDSALLFAIGGEEDQAREQFARVPAGVRAEPQDRAGQHHPARRAGDGRHADASSGRAYFELADRFFALAPDAAGGADAALLHPAPADLQGHQARGRRRARPEPEEHGGRGRPGAERRGRVDPPDGPGPAGRGGGRHADRLAAEPVDPGADPGGDPRGPGDGPGGTRPGRARPRPATSWASWPTRSTRWPGPSASSARRGPPGCCGRSRRRRRRSTRSPTRWWSSTRPARSSGPTRRPGGSSA